MSRMRESLFMILGPVQGLRFLDLFAGSGLMGIEACSRGCRQATFVEKSPAKKSILRKNLSFVKEEHRCFIMDAKRFLLRPPVTLLKPEPLPFHLIYVDPPFRYPEKIRLPALIAASGLAAPRGRIVLHHPKQESDLLTPDPSRHGFRLTDRRSYGGSVLSFFELRENPPVKEPLS